MRLHKTSSKYLYLSPFKIPNKKWTRTTNGLGEEDPKRTSGRTNQLAEPHTSGSIVLVSHKPVTRIQQLVTSSQVSSSQQRKSIVWVSSQSPCILEGTRAPPFLYTCPWAPPQTIWVQWWDTPARPHTLFSRERPSAHWSSLPDFRFQIGQEHWSDKVWWNWTSFAPFLDRHAAS